MCGVLTSRKENHLNFNKLKTIFYHETEICLIIKVSSEIYKSHERERLVWSSAWGQFDISASAGLARARDTVSCPLTISLSSTVIWLWYIGDTFLNDLFQANKGPRNNLLIESNFHREGLYRVNSCVPLLWELRAINPSHFSLESSQIKSSWQALKYSRPSDNVSSLAFQPKLAQRCQSNRIQPEKG